MRILLHKVSDERHVLEIVRDDGRRERIECRMRRLLGRWKATPYGDSMELSWPA
jgi:hypothetical protein